MSSEGPYWVHDTGGSIRTWEISGPEGFCYHCGFYGKSAAIICRAFNAIHSAAYLSGQRDERERCAKIADSYGDAMPDIKVWKGRNSYCIAAAIRAGEKGEG